LILRHAELTQSPRARWILENFEHMLPKFVKVFPHEYKRVLGVPRLAAGAKTHDAPVHHAPAANQRAQAEVARG